MPRKMEVVFSRARTCSRARGIGEKVEVMRRLGGSPVVVGALNSRTEDIQRSLLLAQIKNNNVKRNDNGAVHPPYARPSSTLLASLTSP